jgi:LysM repeat protein
MNLTQRRGMNMVFVLVVTAVFCAVATFVAITLVSNRGEAPVLAQPDLPEEVLVDGMIITMSTDPRKAVYMPDQSPEPSGPESGGVTEGDQGQAQPTTAPLPTDTPPPPPPAVESVIFVSYVVQPGDSLYSIADQYNTSIELMALYGIDGDDMVAGTALSLPVPNPAFCPGMTAYVVRDKDTVFRIAHQFNTTAQAIQAANNLDANYTIKTTQVICIP